MDRYIEMGFSETSAAAAIERHGDDLHAGCHWLMTRESMGSVPKRLKTSSEKEERTYLGSTMRFEGIMYTVDAYDKRHALIRIRCSTTNKARWEHMSDGRMEWQSVQHKQDRISVPRYAWKRKIGNVYLKTDCIDEQVRGRLTRSNALSMFISHGRPGYEPQWSIWRAMASLTKEHVHEPSGPIPKGGSQNDIHDYRVEWTTYFHALADIYNISRDELDNLLWNGNHSEILSKFPKEIHSKLVHDILKWKKPMEQIRKEQKEWRKNCLPVVLFECECLESDCAHFGVYFHDMTFVKPNRYEPGVHGQMQRLFNHLWSDMMQTSPSASNMNGITLKSTLRGSQKKFISPANPSETFVSELMLYQRKCLRWMSDREKTSSTSAWGWKRHQLQDGFAFYTSVFGHLSLSSPNDKIHGGLIAQDVGMGKTVEMLAHIATCKAPGPTLVVMPTTMLGPWQTEASKHVPSLKVIKFHGPRRTKNMQDLKQADIVLTTYRIVVSETSQHIPTIGSVKWGRIILDESHEMKSIFHETTKAITRLYAPNRWLLSATPWPKGMINVSSMLAFLGVAPFDESPRQGHYSAAQLAIRNQSKFNPGIFKKCLQEMTYWQKKSHVTLHLPPVNEQVIECPNHFKGIYTHFKSVILARMEIDAADSTVNGRTRMLHYIRWLRQAAIHPSLNRLSEYGVPTFECPVRTESREINSFLETLGEANYDQSLRDIIDSWRNGQEKCSICMDAMDRPTLTPCHHMFCFECINTAYQHDHAKRCPLCRKSAGSSPLEELKLPEDFVENVVSENSDCYVEDLHGAHTKMPKDIHDKIVSSKNKLGSKYEKLLDMIQNTDEKFIVFTQFHGAWKMLCKILTEQKISFASIEGKMTPKQRNNQIEKFQTDSHTKVFAMTTKTASVGITLTAGSQVVFLEPCLDKSIRKQAIGRAHRIGQQKPVVVTTLRSVDSIDCTENSFTIADLRAYVSI